MSDLSSPGRRPRRVLVLGAATSGLAAALLARRLGDSVSVYDARPSASPELLSHGLAVVTGDWDSGLLSGIDLVVASPGFSERSHPVVDAIEAGVPIWSEIELGWRELDAPVVAVTGTNGKTTVTGLIADMLSASGMRAKALGNIGAALSDAVEEPLDVAVVEVSSFQLRFIDRFHPGIAVVTNVAPDHLDWHGSHAAYFEAKARILENQGEGDVLVYDSDDEGARLIAARARGRVLAVSVADADADAFATEGELAWGPTTVPRERLRTSDPAFLADILMAGAAALEAGASPRAVAEVAARFSPGAHRRSLVGRRDGVTFVDDSKATNPHAALAAIRAYPSVVLIAGGLAKGLDPGPLSLEPNVRHVVAIGTAAPRLLAAAGDRGVAAGTMEEAVEIAARLARSGDTVLLAPGCASFDMFGSYAERGDAFAAAVSTIIGDEAE